MTSSLPVNTAPRRAAPHRRPRRRAARTLAGLCLGASALAGGAAPTLAATITHTALYTFHGDDPGARFGYSVSGAGDVNNDGKADVIVGARYADTSNGDMSGSARVLSGADGTTLYTFDGDGADDWFGESVSGAGDVNGDGHADLIVGAYGDDTSNGTDSGSARVLSGKDGSELYTFNGALGNLFGHSVSGAGDVNGDGFDDVIVGPLYGNYAKVLSGKDGSELVNADSNSGGFGHSVSGAGDVNGDGRADLIVGAPGAHNNGFRTGRARVLSGDDGTILYTFDGDSEYDRLGYSVSGAGDVNGDGFDDVIVGAPGDTISATKTGRARVLSGADGTTLYTFYGDSVDDEFGWSVSGAGDVNGDGRADLIVGAPFDDNNGTDSGSARVLSGADGTILATFDGDSVEDRFGSSVSGAGDVNNDGIADFIVGAQLNGANGGGYARLFVSNGAGLEEGGAVPVPGALALLGAGLAALRYLRRR